MSHLPGRTLEDFLCWNYDLVDDQGQFEDGITRFYKGRKVVTVEQVRELAKIFEPCREYIEYKLGEFDEETQSWRNYGATEFDCIDPELYARGLAYLESLGELPRTTGIA